MEAFEALAQHGHMRPEYAQEWGKIKFEIYAELRVTVPFSAVPLVHRNVVRQADPVHYLSNWPPFQIWVNTQAHGFQADMEHPETRKAFIQQYLQS